MADESNQATDEPRPRPKKKRALLKGLVVLLGLAFLGWELYVFSPGVRVGVVNALGWVGPSALPAVLGFCDDESGEVVAAAVEVLVRSGAKAVPTLEQALRHPEARRRVVAAQLLGRLGPTATPARPALVEAASNDRDRQVRRVAIEALGALGTADPGAVQALAGLLEDGDPEVREVAVLTLGRVVPRPKAVVSALAKRLKDENRRVRWWAAEALEKIGPDAREAIPALTDALQDPDAEVRREAGQALQAVRRSVAPAK